MFDENGQQLYGRLLEALQMLIDLDDVSRSLKQSVTKLRKFMTQKAIKVEVLQIDRWKERQYRKTTSRILLQDEIEITSNVMAADIARAMASSSPLGRTNKRQREHDYDSDDDFLVNVELGNPFIDNSNQPNSFIMKKNDKHYELHTLTTKVAVSLNKPIIQREDRESLDMYFDIRLSTDTVITCSKELNEEYLQHENDAQSHLSLKSILGNLGYISAIFKLNRDYFPRLLFNLAHQQNAFIEFIKYSINDMYVCWNDPDSYVQTGERTIFCEIFFFYNNSKYSGR